MKQKKLSKEEIDKIIVSGNVTQADLDRINLDGTKRERACALNMHVRMICEIDG